MLIKHENSGTCQISCPLSFKVRIGYNDYHFIEIEHKLRGFTFNELKEVIPTEEEQKGVETFFERHGSFDQLTVNDYMPG